MSKPLFTCEQTPDPSSLLHLDNKETEFFKNLTGIQDVEALKNHIIVVQRRACEVCPYPCVQVFGFLRPRISQQPAYEGVLHLLKKRPSAILLDAGCCFGTDIRKAVHDGWPAENVVGTDLEAAFLNFGHDLFKSTPDTFRAAFIPGDMFDAGMVKPREPFYSAPTMDRPKDLRSLKSLTPLQGHASAIHTASVFHLFDEEGQLALAKRLASLLSPEPGSIIFGSHTGRSVKSQIDIVGYGKFEMFCHGPDSWRELWDGQVFQRGTVRVEVELVDYNLEGVNVVEQFLVWSVVRL